MSAEAFADKHTELCSLVLVALGYSVSRNRMSLEAGVNMMYNFYLGQPRLCFFFPQSGEPMVVRTGTCEPQAFKGLLGSLGS